MSVESTSPAAQRRDVLLLLDGHAYAYRAFYAIKSLDSPDGKPTNAIYGFIKMLGKLIEATQPTHVAVVWDGGLDEARLQELPGYKSQRPEMPSSLASQLDQIILYLQAANIASLQKDGIEADDWIGAIAKTAAGPGLQVIIASSDKDFMQLVSEDVGLINPNDKTGRIWSAKEVSEKTGVTPRQIVDWLSLIGDSVDEIPGVPGVGPKTATKLLSGGGSVQSLYADLEKVEPASLREKLAGSRAVIERNQRMIRLHEKLPAPLVMGDFQVREPEKEPLRQLFRTWGFRSMLRDLGESDEPQMGLL